MDEFIKYKGSGKSFLTSLYKNLGQSLSNYTFGIFRTSSKNKKAGTTTKEIWLKSILVSAMDAIISIDSKHNIILFNRAAETMFGYTSKEIMGKPLNILLPENYRKQHTDHINRFGATGISTRHMRELGIVSGRRSNGEEFPLEASISQFDMEGEKYLTVILRDVTRRLQYERNIAEGKETYRNLFNSIPDAIFVLDTEGTILNINQQALELYRYSSEEFLSGTLSLLNAGGKQEIDSIQKRIASADRGNTENFEWKCKSKDGKIIQSDFTLTKGRYFGKDVIIATAHNITERKKKEEQIKLFENIIKSVNDSITFLSLDGTILFVNNAFGKTFGYKEDDITGKNIDILFSSDNPVYLYRHIMVETFKKGWSGELVAKRKDGKNIPVYLSTSAIYDSEGKPSGLVGVSLDMTKQKQLEGQLIHSHKMESLRILVEGIAHNFNNILAIIMGYTSLSQHENVSREKLISNLDVVLEATERGASLVKQLFTFSTKSHEQLQNIYLNSILEETIRIIQDTFQSYIAITLDFSESEPVIAADHKELRQAILNVLINAQEAMPTGGTIRITTRIVQDKSKLPPQTGKVYNNEYVQLSISDTGPGMTGEIREKIFNPFFTTKDIGQGIGLGLTITYGIIERYNGLIDVESTPGKGTNVNIFLPLVKEPKVTKAGTTEGKPIVKSIPAGILIVEDEEAFRKLLTRNLEKSGYSVLSASDGQEAIEVYSQHRESIDIILLDIGLPIMNGTSILKIIRKENTEVKVIVMTGYDTTEMAPLFDELSVNDIVHKPFDIDMMLDRIKKVLNN